MAEDRTGGPEHVASLWGIHALRQRRRKGARKWYSWCCHFYPASFSRAVACKTRGRATRGFLCDVSRKLVYSYSRPPDSLTVGQTDGRRMSSPLPCQNGGLRGQEAHTNRRTRAAVRRDRASLHHQEKNPRWSPSELILSKNLLDGLPKDSRVQTDVRLV